MARLRGRAPLGWPMGRLPAARRALNFGADQRVCRGRNRQERSAPATPRTAPTTVVRQRNSRRRGRWPQTRLQVGASLGPAILLAGWNPGHQETGPTVPYSSHPPHISNCHHSQIRVSRCPGSSHLNTKNDVDNRRVESPFSRWATSSPNWRRLFLVLPYAPGGRTHR